MRRGEEVGEMVMTRDWPVLHVACWSQGLRSESPMAVTVAVAVAVAVAE
jgi:hypothetical protein